MSEKLKIVGLKMENIKRIEAVELQFDENNNLVEITGANGAGKTSLLDGLKFLFSGAKGTDAMPIREGTDNAIVEAELKKYATDGSLLDTGLIVQKKFNPSGPVIKIYKKEGIGNIASSQKILDTLYDAISFDPLAFAELSKTNDGRKRQVELVKKLTGLDFSELEKEYDGLYSLRTDINRKAKEIETNIKGREPNAALPEKESSASEIIKQIQEANQYNEERDSLDRDIAQKESCIANTQDGISLIDKKIAELQQEKTAQLNIIEDETKNLNKMKEEFSLKNIIDIQPLQDRLAKVEETNTAIKDNNELVLLHKELNDFKDKQTEIETKMEKLRTDKQTQLASAKMPIPGMSFTSEGILVNNIPFEQINDADKLKTSVAMAMALNPVLRVILIKNGSLLDKKNYDILKQMAKDNDYTIFLEKVDESGEVGIVIEEGKVKVDNYQHNAV